MRVISGKLGGRIFSSPNGHRTHPMSDKLRGSLFNKLGDITGLVLLDAFAGSGALSLEAISRGAKHVTAVDINKKAYDVLRRNVKALNIENNVKAIRANINGWSSNNPNILFDLVLADPPYDDLQLSTVQKIALHVKTSGLLALNWPASETLPELERFDVVNVKRYGNAQLIFYQHL